MSDPRETQRDQEPDAPADPEPEVKMEVIEDLNVPSDDAEHIAGASLINCQTR